MSEPAKLGKVYCPICKTLDVALYPYDNFVKHHHHPIRRYFAGYLMYGRWWKQYHKDLAKIKGEGKWHDSI